jgi:hypothetical protein
METCLRLLLELQSRNKLLTPSFFGNSSDEEVKNLSFSNELENINACFEVFSIDAVNLHGLNRMQRMNYAITKINEVKDAVTKKLP